MFNLGLFEILAIAIVAVLAIGPKELPLVMAQVGRVVKRLNYLRYAVQGQVNEYIKQAGLEDLKDNVNFEAPYGGSAVPDVEGDSVALAHVQAMEKVKAAEAAEAESKVAVKKKATPQKVAAKKAPAKKNPVKKSPVKKAAARTPVKKTAKKAVKTDNKNEGGA